MLTDVLFDLDGTLVDSVPGIQWSVEEAMRECGLDCVCPDLTASIGPPIRAILAMAAATRDPGMLDRLETAFRLAYDGGGWRLTRCHAGVRTMLDELLDAGVALSIVTNKPSHATQLILSDIGMRECFQEIVCRDSKTPSYGSKAEMVTGLLDRRGIAREACLLVGDTLEDCHAAATAGIECAVVPHGYGSGLDGELPRGCRLVSGWDEILRSFSFIRSFDSSGHIAPATR